MTQIEMKESLTPLLESSNQIHLTIYLENARQDLTDLKQQIQISLEEAKRTIERVLDSDEQRALLLPIENLLQDTRVLRQLKGNIGIFRTRSAFRILSLPVDIRRSCHVATTFHVKPLLRWIQWDSEFLVLGLTRDSAHLYQGSQQSILKMDAILFPRKLSDLFQRAESLTLSEIRELKAEAQRTFSWVKDWMKEAAPHPKTKLYIAGEPLLTDRYFKCRHDARAIKKPVASAFSEERMPEITSRIRSMLRTQAKERLQSALLTFQIADQMNLARNNIREIARAAAQGRVKKLVIAENREVFGKLDPKTGQVSIHPYDMDHEDDDLLDDLAQLVLNAGGEVYVAKKEEIPNGRPLLAIFDEEKELSKFRLSDPARSGISENKATA